MNVFWDWIPRTTNFETGNDQRNPVKGMQDGGFLLPAMFVVWLKHKTRNGSSSPRSGRSGSHSDVGSGQACLGKVTVVNPVPHSTFRQTAKRDCILIRRQPCLCRTNTISEKATLCQIDRLASMTSSGYGLMVLTLEPTFDLTSAA